MVVVAGATTTGLGTDSCTKYRNNFVIITAKVIRTMLFRYCIVVKRFPGLCTPYIFFFFLFRIEKI